ncbi:MAG: alpha/beta fold hydrolase [Pontibacterium sp.]
MHTDSVLCMNSRGLHRMVYHQWGSSDNERVLVCVHGLVRNGRDFDKLAKYLSREYRVICPDIAGRGKSDWLDNPEDYHIEQYLRDVMALLGRLGVKDVDWLGTSMGGIMGMTLASMPKSPIKRLILNDIGAEIPSVALKRIAGYLGSQHFKTLKEAETYLRALYTNLVNITDKNWEQVTQHSTRALPDGGFALHYDSTIANNFLTLTEETINLWPIWQGVSCPVAVIHGETSDILTAETLQAMKEQRPDTDILEVPSIGHVPSLMETDQIQWIRQWLRSH